MSRLFSLALLLAVLPLAVAADPPVGGKGPFVVAAGVSRTGDPKIQPRATSDADATAVHTLFADPAHLGVPAARNVLLTSAAAGDRAATRANVLAAVRRAVAETGPGDPVVIALFGRGASAGDATCFFAADTAFATRGTTGLLGTDLAVELKKLADRRLVVLLDIHFKGFDAGKEAIVEPNLSDVLKGVFGTEEKGEEAPLPTDKVVILSAVPGYDPVARGGNSLFTAVLLDALRGKADAEGYEPDGVVTVDELVPYLEKQITDGTRTLGTTVKEKEAIPYIVGEETSHFVLTRNPKAAGVAARIKAFDTAAKALPADQAAEGRRLLTRMPRLKGQQELRKRYQSFADGTLSAADLAIARGELLAAAKLPDADAETFARRVTAAAKMLADEHIRPVTTAELVAGSVTGLYRRLEEPPPAEVADLAAKGKALTRVQEQTLLLAARRHLGRREDLDDGKDADVAVTMMAASLNDPYTVYYDKATIKKMESGLRGEFRGVGIQIRRDLVRDGLLVVSPIKGSPAYAAGIKAGDLITEIRREVGPTGEALNSDAEKVISTKGMKTERALDLILGKPGVPVTLVVERANADGPAETLTFDLKRGVVAVETVLGVRRNADDSWDYYLDAKEKIAYVQLTQFAPATAAELKRVLDRLAADKVKGLVLDLRYNPGGQLASAIQISDLFLPDGVILEVKPRVGKNEVYSDRGFGTFTDLPMAVLVNGQSASASEITSAALQDYSRAVVVGERTYGKGSVQQVKSLPATGGEIKLTISRYYPPLGRNIDRLATKGTPDDEWGVRPDAGYEVVLSREEKQALAEHFRGREVIPRRDAKAPLAAKPAASADRQLDAALKAVRKQLAEAKK